MEIFPVSRDFPWPLSVFRYNGPHANVYKTMVCCCGCGEKFQSRLNYRHRDKGGVRDTAVFADFRRSILKRDRWTCQICGDRNHRDLRDESAPLCQEEKSQGGSLEVNRVAGFVHGKLMLDDSETGLWHGGALIQTPALRADVRINVPVDTSVAC